MKLDFYSETISPDISTNNITISSGLIVNGTFQSNSFSTTESLTSANVVTTTSTTPTTIFSIDITLYRSAQCQVQLSSGTNYTSTNLAVIHNGTTPSMDEFGKILIGSSLGTFDASISAGFLNISFTASSSASTTVKIVCTAITI